MTTRACHMARRATWHETFSKQMMATVTQREKDGKQPFDIPGIYTVLPPQKVFVKR